VKPDEQPDNMSPPKPKAPYERPELKKIGRLRDVTAAGTEDG